MRLDFDAAAHKYSLVDDDTGETKEIPSATQILSGLGLVDFSRFTQADMQRGTDRHLATELWDRGSLDEGSLDDNTRPALEAWRKFLDDSGFKESDIEVRVSSLSKRYAGTVDRVGSIDGKRTMIDIKGSSEMPTYALQLWLYKIAWEEMHEGDRMENLISVHLRRNGTYRVHSHHGNTSAARAASGLADVFAWREGALMTPEARVGMESLAKWLRECVEKGS